MARKKVDVDPIPGLLEEAAAAQGRGREILDTLSALNGEYVPLLEELQELESTILRIRRNVAAINENIPTGNEDRRPYDVPADINALVRTHRNSPVTDISVLPQIVADGPFWEGTSPQYVRYKG